MRTCIASLLFVTAALMLPDSAGTPAAHADMMKDSPVTFPERGALPAKYPPDVRSEERESPEPDYSIFSTPNRSLEQIAAIQAEMPEGQFT
ncbi:MAG: hypothetical protein RBS80_28270, partial [Thermoguttaceae bacterium]|nr:hypothetical protein [Thermoguttaceae bacterium]